MTNRLPFSFSLSADHRYPHVLTHSVPTRRSADLSSAAQGAPASSSRHQISARRPAAAQAASSCSRSDQAAAAGAAVPLRSEEHTSELQSLMRISYAVFCLKKTK